MVSVRIVNNIPKVINRLKANASGFYQKAGEFCKDRMDDYVAVDTGNLRAHNNFYADDSQMILYNDEEEYNFAQEFGTAYQPGTPYIRPAVYNHFDDLSRIGREELGRGF